MIHPLPISRQTPPLDEMESVARAKIGQLTRCADELLIQTTDADPATAELLRAELTRLAGVSFTITRYLCHDDLPRAYAVACGDALDGEVLGLTA